MSFSALFDSRPGRRVARVHDLARDVRQLENMYCLLNPIQTSRFVAARFVSAVEPPQPICTTNRLKKSERVQTAIARHFVHDR